jgi:hypothetical protein
LVGFSVGLSRSGQLFLGLEEYKERKEGDQEEKDKSDP